MINKKKGKLFLITIQCIIFSSFLGCGTLGGIGNVIYFSTSKKKLEVAIDSLYSKHPEYRIPEKWKVFNSWSENGYGFLESRIFYFNSSPEEMYYVTFIGDSAMLADATKTGIGVRAVFNGDANGKWFLDQDLDSREKQRMEKRFDGEIISKLEEYTKTKISKE